MATKTDFPIAVLEVLKPWINKTGKLYKPIQPKSEEHLVKFQSVDYPEFYFTIAKFNSIHAGKASFAFARKPANKFDPSATNGSIDDNQIDTQFNMWLELLETYNMLPSPYEAVEDRLLKQYEDEFYQDCIIIDDDADTHSYDLKTQILIGTLADNIIAQVSSYQGNIQEADRQIIIEETVNLKETQTSSTKREVVKKLSKIAARLRKVGLDITKDSLKDLAKETFKFIVKEGFKLLLSSDPNNPLLP